MPSSYFESTPVEFAIDHDQQPTEPRIGESEGDRKVRDDAEKIRKYVIGWRDQLRTYRYEKLTVWNECWQLYRGQEDWSDKEDWQSKIVLPKAFASVKQATNVIKRFLNASKKPFNLESENPNDQESVIRSEQMTHLVEVFLEKARFLDEFSESLECGFIIGAGIMKLWWGLVPRVVTKVQTTMVPRGMAGVTDTTGQGPQQYSPQPIQPSNPSQLQPAGPIGGPTTGGSGIGLEPPEQQPLGGGVPVEAPASNRTTQPIGQLPKSLIQQDSRLYPPAMANEYISPMNLPGASQANAMGGGIGLGGETFIPPPMVPHKQIVREEILEGKLFTRAVDPYNFYWLPGSKMNQWTGTIEEIELPKWELIQMAQEGIFDPELVKKIQPMKIEETNKQSWLRFGEMPRTTNGPNGDTGVIKLTEFYGPIVIDGEVKERWGHVLIANDSITLINGKNQFWHRKAPYVGYSPVSLPFRTEGVGLVEMVRQIDKALNRLANMSVDTLMFRLMPLFEISTDAFENPEDFETGMVPGKMFRRNMQYPQLEGIKPVQFEDISQGSVQLAAELNVAHQEGSLISQIQQSLPRYRGIQTATETQAMQDNQQSFFGSMAADIERSFLAPIVMMAVDLLYQFIDTANDPRVASILGVEAGVLAGMSREEVMELVQGDYKVHVKGITGQLEKAEMLQSLVQFMNLIGQNPQAWLPYINQSKLLQRILEAFRPTIHDVEEIIADPETVHANRQAMMGEQVTPDLVRLIPDLVRMQHDQSRTMFDQAQAQAEQQNNLHTQAHQAHQSDVDQALQIAQVRQAQQSLDAPPTPTTQT